MSCSDLVGTCVARMVGPMTRAVPKPKRRKRPTLPSRKTLKRDLDALAREWTLGPRARCVTCGSAERLQWSHLLSRTVLATRWDRRNMYPQCAGCHHSHHVRDPVRLLRAAECVWGHDAIESLRREFWSPRPMSREDLRVLRACWQAWLAGEES